MSRTLSHHCRALADRVERRGLRPATLPHPRTCGFPHPAVEASGLTVRQNRWHQRAIRSRTSLSVRSSAKVPPRDRRRQARCGSTASARCTRGAATAVVAPLDLRPLPGFPPVTSLALPCFFGPSLQPRYWPSSLLRPLLTSPPLSRGRSPQVRCRTFPLVPPGST